MFFWLWNHTWSTYIWYVWWKTNHLFEVTASFYHNLTEIWKFALKVFFCRILQTLWFLKIGGLVFTCGYPYVKDESPLNYMPVITGYCRPRESRPGWTLKKGRKQTYNRWHRICSTRTSLLHFPHQMQAKLGGVKFDKIKQKSAWCPLWRYLQFRHSTDTHPHRQIDPSTTAFSLSATHRLLLNSTCICSISPYNDNHLNILKLQTLKKSQNLSLWWNNSLTCHYGGNKMLTDLNLVTLYHTS